MCSRMEAAEQARNTLQVGLAEVERSREALWEKNTHLEAQLQKAEETGAQLQADLRGIQEEKEELQEKLSEVRSKMHTVTLRYNTCSLQNTTEMIEKVIKSYFLEMTSVTSLGYIFQFLKRIPVGILRDPPLLHPPV